MTEEEAIKLSKKKFTKEIRRIKRTLTAYDFDNKTVRIKHNDGSKLELKNAFLRESHEICLLNIKNGVAAYANITWVAVFTEHVGNFVFYGDDLEYWNEQNDN